MIWWQDPDCCLMKSAPLAANPLLRPCLLYFLTAHQIEQRGAKWPTRSPGCQTFPSLLPLCTNPPPGKQSDYHVRVVVSVLSIGPLS